MRERKILFLAGMWAVCAAGTACASIADMEIPLNDTGWSVFVGSDIFDQVGVHVLGVRPNSHTVLLELDKWFTRPKDPDTGFTAMQFRFVKTDNASAYSKFVIKDEFIVNDTGADWYDFHMFLVPNGRAGFDNSTKPDGDKLPNVGYKDFYGYNQLPVTLDFDNGTVPHTGPSNYFRPGYQSGDIVIVTPPNLTAGQDFLLKEIPTPEPVSILLLLGLSWFGLRKKRSP